MSTNPKYLYRYETLPKMEKAVGREEAQTLLNQIVEENSSEAQTKDSGCICEIDLSQVNQIRQIMTQLHARVKDPQTDAFEEGKSQTDKMDS